MKERPKQVRRRLIKPEDLIQVTPPTERPDRMTVIFNTHHEQSGEQPTSRSCNYSALLRNKVQSYFRRLKVGLSEVPLDLGWFRNSDQIGSIVIENRAGSGGMVKLSTEEKEQLEKKLIYVHIGDARLIIEPGKFLLFNPELPDMIFISAEEEETPINIHIYPR